MSRKQRKDKRRKPPVAKNEMVTLTIEGLSHEGAGVGRVHGFTLFVHGALPGEVAQVKVVMVRKKFGFGKLLKIEQESEDRVAPPCPVFTQCGGCQLQHASYAAQLSMKREQVQDALMRIGKLSSDVIVHPTLGMDEPWRYRNKSQVPIGVASDQAQPRLITGFYAPGSHRIVDTDDCIIQHEAHDRIMQTVKQIGTELGISVYDEEAHQGLLRHVVIRTGFHTGEVMAVLVTNGKQLPHADEWVRRIRVAVPNVTSICQNVNTRRTNVILGEETRVLWGSDVIYDELGGLRFAISPRSFYQVNPLQTEVLYAKALEYVGLSGSETVIDAYCGIGTIALYSARQAKQVYGVEIVPEAIEDARRNAKLNELDNVTFEVGAAEEVMPAWREQGVQPDVIVVDPPRKGCDEVLLQTIIALRPERVVYVSCNPATLARDLAVLEAGGYQTNEVQPVDMFPHTAHVECVARLVWK